MRGIREKRGQEEIVGFAVIVIIVAVIMLFLLTFYLRRDSGIDVESFELDSFIQSSLHYTTDCRGGRGGYFSVQEIIFECSIGATCQDGRNACDVLESTLGGIIDASWQVGEDRPVKGYNLTILSNEEEVMTLDRGNATRDFRGANQDFSRLGEAIHISFRVYS